MSSAEHMERRTYAAENVITVACELVQLEKSQLCAVERKTPRWATMGREAVAGATYELASISYPELASMLGHHAHGGVMAQVQKFNRQWPRHIRRSWLEAVLVRLDHEVRS